MSLRFKGMLVLALLAFGLLGYAWYAERQAVQALEAEVQQKEQAIEQMRSAGRQAETAFFIEMTSEDLLQELEAIAAAPARSDRERLAAGVYTRLMEYRVQFVVAEEVIARIDMIVRAPDDAERQNILTDLNAKVEAMWPAPEEEPFVAEEASKRLSTLVAALSAAGSALGSLFLFLTSGWKREYEQEMMAIDVEKRRVELAVMQHEAREALEYKPPRG